MPCCVTIEEVIYLSHNVGQGGYQCVLQKTRRRRDMSFPGGPVEVFCSYAPEDEIYRHQLETHLSLLQREGLLSLWHPRKIVPGTDWSKCIDEHLSKAAIILLLISSDFLASDYCYGVEMALALQLHEANKARVLPIIARSVLWQSSPFSHLSVLPTNARAIARWRDRDDALTDVANGIRQAINNLQAHSEKVAGSERTRIWNIPLPRNRFFLGRDDLLADLTSRLHTTRALAVSQPQALSGLGGGQDAACYRIRISLCPTVSGSALVTCRKPRSADIRLR